MTLSDYDSEVQMIWPSLQDEKVITPEQVQKRIKIFLPAFKEIYKEKYSGMSDDELINSIFRQIETLRVNWISKKASTLENNENHIPWLEHKKTDIQWEFWNRYRDYQKICKGYNKDLLTSLDTITDNILGRMEDPKREGTWDRRGLVVGEIQSGKTSNYIGLICKAIDSGYKLIVVLAGIHNSLRSQTQQRINEGILGFNPTQSILSVNAADTGYYTGVGTLPDFKPHGVCSFTNTNDNGDFGKKIVQQAGILPGNNPIILVVKKNATILKYIKQWTQKSLGSKVDDLVKIPEVPLLLIDDEADYASIHTGKIFDEDGNPLEDYDPTKINGLIREILNSFEKSIYLGYTATPFANIFIFEPEKPSRKYGKDLFPEHFILNMPVPKNYVGSSLFFGQDAAPEAGFSEQEGLPIVTIIDDYQEAFPEKHKKDHIVRELPESLKKAIRCFILSSATRSARGQSTVHNSMLIHVTRYIAVQDLIKNLVDEEITYLKQRIQYDSPEDLQLLYNEFENLYSNQYIPNTEKVNSLLSEKEISDPSIEKTDWEIVKGHIPRSTLKITVKKINGTAGDVFDYAENDELGVNVIVIGGDKLSRGLTLEGLTISYYLRSARMYDTLMQMGRWFGYRPGYLDLCRVYTSKELADWYRHITLASTELRHEFNIMADLGLTPKDFGLKVRTHPDGLIITSVNKMRSGTKLRLSYSGTISETVVFHSDKKIILENISSTKRFLKNLGEYTRITGKKEYYKWKNINSSIILDYLADYKAHPSSYKANPELLRKYIESVNEKDMELNNWTVVLISGRPGSKIRLDEIELTCVQRAIMSSPSGSSGRYSIRRLVSPADEILDLSDTEQSEVKKRYEKYKEQYPEEKISNGCFIRNVRKPENGYLILYPIEFIDKTDEDDEKIIEKAIGFAISFPESPSGKTIEYVVNNEYYKQEFEPW